jgi:hypothetical protein
MFMLERFGIWKPEFNFLALQKTAPCITTVVIIMFYCKLEKIAHIIIAHCWQNDPLNSCSVCCKSGKFFCDIGTKC